MQKTEFATSVEQKVILPLTVKVKEQKVDDQKEYLARKTKERAARCNSVVESAVANTQPGVLDLWRARGERLGGISALVNTSEVYGDAAKGKL